MDQPAVNPLKYHIITLGCQMNKNDSERIETVLRDIGMESAENPGQADAIILNSCSVRKSAEDRIFGLVRNFAKLKKKNPGLIICVTGCMPGRDKDGKLRKKLKDVDLFFPIKDIVNLPKWLSELNQALRPIDLEQDYLKLNPSHQSPFQTFVTIQTGCNHFCSYCIVPSARGLEVNRPLKDILEEVKNLAKNGCIEITLLGQIVNNYKAHDRKNFSKKNIYTKSDFAKLLWELNQIKGIERIHWTAPHPVYMDDEVIDALSLPKQVNFLHLPVQSGSDKILKKMNRRHNRNFYINLIKKIRTKKPDIAIGTDIIVGFCGETEKDFKDTLDLYKQCDFDISYTARYSERPGTAASKTSKDSVPRQEKKKRWQILHKLMEKIVFEKNQKYVEKKVSVLVDGCKNGLCYGNSSEMKRVQFPEKKSLIGKIVEIEIIKAGTWILWGKKVKQAEKGSRRA